MSPILRIDVYADTVCPWCYLGKRRLDATLASRTQHPARVTWRPFELNPDLPAEGVDRRAFLDARVADRKAYEEAEAALVELGRAAGIEFRFDRITRLPNSRRSHVLLAHAARLGLQGELLERLWRAYFTEGCDVGDLDELVRLGVEAGLEERDVVRTLVLRRGQDGVLAAERHALAIGLTGVPAFVLNGEYFGAGAREPAELAAAIDQVTALADGGSARA
jgi:predicted DsbA family dithiol-disulfide isomerase